MPKVTVGRNCPMNFSSDGVAFCAPEIFNRLMADRPVTTAVFDADEITAGLKRRIEQIFGREADIFTVATGSASNSLALAAMTPAYGAILCHHDAHIVTDECGAPEMMTGGAKLVGLPGAHGKIALSDLDTALANARFGFTHAVQPHALSLSQITEAGTIYSRHELRVLCAAVKEYGLRVHMDGARFANAVAALNCEPAELSWEAGVDILSLGATKNGAIAAEVMIVFVRSLSERVRYIRKR
jgi:threonine aldolase